MRAPRGPSMVQRRRGWLGVGVVAGLAAVAGQALGRRSAHPRIEVVSSVRQQRGRLLVQLRLRHLGGPAGEVRGAYLLFASGAGIALRPALGGSVALPLRLAPGGQAELRYDLVAAGEQLSHHPRERLRAVGCVVGAGALVRRPLAAELARALHAAAQACAPRHPATCPGCSDVLVTAAPRWWPALGCG